MLPSSHPVPILSAGDSVSGQGLVSAFAEFGEAARALEGTYRTLRSEVASLRAVLKERSRELRLSRKETIQAKSTLRQILDALPCGVLVVDHDRQLTFSNPAAHVLLGSFPNTKATIGELPQPFRAQLEKVLTIASPRFTEEELYCPGLTSHWLTISRSEFQLSTGDDVGSLPPRLQTVLILRDSTSHKKLEEERESARDSVALAEISNLFSHEIRNPLAGIELLAGLLEAERPPTSETIVHIRADVRSLSATINDILRLRGTCNTKPRQVLLSDALVAALEFVQPVAQQYFTTINCSLGGHETYVSGDEQALQQVFVDVLLELIKNPRDCSSLMVTAHGTDTSEGKRVSVDFGYVDTWESVGLNETSPDFPSTSESWPTSLRLTVCQRVVDLHRGRLAVRKRNGRPDAIRVELDGHS